MALTDLQRLRLLVSDRERAILTEVLGEGDGTTVDFKMMVGPVVLDSDSVWIAGVAQVRGVDYTIALDLSIVTFTVAPTASAVVTCSYRWTAFTDEELEDVLSRKPSVYSAAIEVVSWLLANRDLFLKYTFGQERVDRSAARDALTSLLDELRTMKGSPIGLVKAVSPERERLMSPFIEQDEDLVNVA